jgi:hypothetical protein
MTKENERSRTQKITSPFFLQHSIRHMEQPTSMGHKCHVPAGAMGDIQKYT